MFWVICALMVIVALWFVLPALLQRPDDQKPNGVRAANTLVYQDQYQELEADLRNGLISEEQCRQDKDELERRLLDELDLAGSGRTAPAAPSAAVRQVAYVVAVAIPLAAISLYFWVGNPGAMTGQAASTVTPRAASQSGEMTQSQIEANVAKLAKKLEQNPNDTQGWIMLARSYSEMQDYKEAAGAYEKATALTSNDADLWADYAFALAMARGRQLQGPPLELVNKALQIDPQNQKALDLAGAAAFEAKSYNQAVEYWQKLLKAMPPNSEAVAPLTDKLNEARRLAKEGGSK
jgi:cytochrome c-type biogenesis protein CcmH